MAASFSSSIAVIVTYRVHREGAIARVRVFVGETAGDCVGELKLRRSEFAAWRATLRDRDPQRMSIWYADGAYEWLHSSGGEVR